uniref:Uncharacterized protein n=1 Tax=Rhizophora mucronata TaxID=61149 RepID=A0A2P2P277_RHIMU
MDVAEQVHDHKQAGSRQEHQ